jgi:NTP pyrophosphatase (non-canonical NTP hydrolase)
MMEHFNKLTAAEDERLAMLTEELGEVLQVIGKIQRHGYASQDPTGQVVGTNRILLETELGHVQAAIRAMSIGTEINEGQIMDAMTEKMRRRKKYQHHQS